MIGHRKMRHCLFGSALVLMITSRTVAAESGWDSVLERDESDESGDHCDPPRGGWQGSDGGFTARHANSDRSIWFFGDTWTADGGWERNSIATTSSSSGNAVPASINFYGRAGGGTWGYERNITKDASASWFTRPWMTSGSSSEWLWPAKAIIPDSSDSLYTFWERVKCVEGSSTCLEDLALASYPRVCTVTDVAGSALHWSNPNCTEQIYPIGNTPPWYQGFWWGSDLVQVGSYLYIYGVTLSYPYETGVAQQVVLARATESTVTNYVQWEFLKLSGGAPAWQTSPPTHPSQMWPVANGAAKHFTVRRISIESTAAWLMVQRHAWGQNEILIRVSPDVWGGILWADYGFAPDTNTMMKNIGHDSAGVDPPCDPGDSAFGVYQQTGHWEISDQANNELMVSYYCPKVNHNLESSHNVEPWGCDDRPAMYWRGIWEPGNPDSTSFEGRIRFYNQDLSKIRPWCTAGEPVCDMP